MENIPDHIIIEASNQLSIQRANYQAKLTEFLEKERTIAFPNNHFHYLEEYSHFQDFILKRIRTMHDPTFFEKEQTEITKHQQRILNRIKDIQNHTIQIQKELNDLIIQRENYHCDVYEEPDISPDLIKSNPTYNYEEYIKNYQEQFQKANNLQYLNTFLSESISRLDERCLEISDNISQCTTLFSQFLEEHSKELHKLENEFQQRKKNDENRKKFHLLNNSSQHIQNLLQTKTNSPLQIPIFNLIKSFESNPTDAELDKLIDDLISASLIHSDNEHFSPTKLPRTSHTIDTNGIDIQLKKLLSQPQHK